MERASQALVRMDYLSAEAQCLDALRRAREAEQWAYYARILLPLQEARRQRRMIAAEGTIRLGTRHQPAAITDWLRDLDAGCLVLTQPATADQARALESEARRTQRYVELLLADNAPDADRWTLRAFRGPAVTCTLAAPPAAWRDAWLQPGERPDPGADAALDAHYTPADWFIDATEALGDAALQQVQHPRGSAQRISELEQMLEVITDHEYLHQYLADAARAMQHSVA